MRKRQSAIIVQLPLPSSLERIRRTCVPVAMLGVPAHVTILYPFLAPDAFDEPVRRRLTAVAGRSPAFEVEFTAVGRFPDAIYLQPSPVEPFQQLTAGVVEAFPDLAPYGDPSLALEDLVPHLTIAMRNRAHGEAVETIATSLLPVRRTVRSLTVIVEGGGGRWEPRWRIRLARP
jgi:2'-5' RNA ligase